MINIQKYQELLDSGLGLDHYVLLCSLRDGAALPKSRRVQGFLNLLHKKEYIDETATLTDKGLELVQDSSVITTTTEAPEVSGKKVADFNAWIVALHQKCQDRVAELTGKRQVRSRIGKSSKAWPFIPNLQDFAKNIARIVTLYKLKDYDKIERALIKHIDNCNDSNNWFPIIKYYIIKDGNSNLVTDLDDVDEEDNTQSTGSSQKFI